MMIRKEKENANNNIIITEIINIILIIANISKMNIIIAINIYVIVIIYTYYIKYSKTFYTYTVS